jgi:hypothetical protein
MDVSTFELFAASFALKRGWRRAVVACLAPPLALEALAPGLFALLGAWLEEARAFVHGLALAGLALLCAVGPAELPALAARCLDRLSRRDPGPLYQI